MGKADPQHEEVSQTNVLRTLITSEQDRGPDFNQLAHALSALFPRSGQEDRVLDTMLPGVPR